jgi:hypothetical protein
VTTNRRAQRSLMDRCAVWVMASPKDPGRGGGGGSWRLGRDLYLPPPYTAGIRKLAVADLQHPLPCVQVRRLMRFPCRATRQRPPPFFAWAALPRRPVAASASRG